MENILPTELIITKGTEYGFMVIVTEPSNKEGAIICNAFNQHKEVIEKMVKLYNEYQKKQGK